MKACVFGAVVLLATIVAGGCGGNSVSVAVTVAPNTATVLLSGTQLFTATVTGTSTTTVTWGVSQGKNTPITGGNSTLGTITPNGLYTGPKILPNPNSVTITATSVANTNVNGTATVTLDSGIRVRVIPASSNCASQLASPAIQIGEGETFGFLACVTGTSNTAVTWEVNNIAGGNSSVGTISPAGVYLAPKTNTLTATISAVSAADSHQSGTETVSVLAAADPTLTSLDQTTVAQGSVQQDLYLTGTNFFSTSTVLVNGSSNNVQTTFISGNLLRSRILAPALAAAGSLAINVQRQKTPLNPNGDLSAPVNLTVVAVRPTLISSSPDSLPKNSLSPSVFLTGGFFTASTQVQFNGQPQIVTLQNGDPRHLTVNLSGTGLGQPGLYSLVVSNTGLPVGSSAMAATNLAVTSLAGDIPNAPQATVALGVGVSSPSAVAINIATNTAVVANSGSNNISIINLTSLTSSTLNVGKNPTGVAVDDLLNLALVVNSGDNSVSVVNLSTNTVAPIPLALAGFTPPGSGIAPFSVGINSMTHRGLVVNKSTNTATVIDLNTSPPSVLSTLGGSANPISTGASPSIAVDPRLNWAVVTPGGAGAISIVDLGRPSSAGNGGRSPSLVATLALSTTARGISIDSETKQALVTDANGSSTATLFSVLDNTPISVPLTPGDVASAINPLTDLGVTVNPGGVARVIDLRTQQVLQTVVGLSSPVAVAIDPGSNTAVVANQGDNSVSILSLGPIRPLQIVEASPDVTLTSSQPLTLTVTGTNFSSSSTVRLDGVAVPTVTVASSCATPSTCRQLSANIPTMPVNMLSSPRRYVVDVQDTTQAFPLSNVTDLTVIQAVAVGSVPVGVAIDTDHDLAVVANSGSNDVSIVNLTNGTASAPISVGGSGGHPQGVAVLSRLGQAAVVNSGTNTISVLDIVNKNLLGTVSNCGTCTTPNGVAINPDTATAVVVNTASNNISTFVVAPPATVAGAGVQVDQQPLAVGIDPIRNFAAVATASQTSTVNLVNLATGALAGRVTGLQLPTGVGFDPVSEEFLVADSLSNRVDIVDPANPVLTPLRVGVNPTSLDYDFQSSTLVTANSASNTLSVVDFLNQRVRAVLGLAGSPQFAVAVDAKLNLAVLVDQDNNRVLLVPLPH